MTKSQIALRDFHKFFGLTVNDLPTIPSDKDLRLRANLIKEEAEEYLKATDDIIKEKSLDNFAHLSKELADILYVVYGAAVTLGIDLCEVFEEVHRSNLTKVWPNGKIKRRKSDGKIIKPKNYSPADILKVITRQLEKRHSKLTD